MIPVLILFLLSTSLHAQCPEVKPDETEIRVDQESRLVNIRINPELNLRRMEVSLYNMDNAAYYYDSGRKKEVVNVRGLSVNIRNNELEIKNLIPGDFVIIVENPGCEKQVIGWGYSGLPDSGIRINE